MFLHRICETLKLSDWFSVVTANGIALVALISTLAVYKFVLRKAALRKSLNLNGNACDCVAEKLAEHLAKLRDEISWYEDQARANNLPKYPN